MKRVITYGTFDVLHIGHINLLRRARALGDYLIVGLSTDEFNAIKHKESFSLYEDRKVVLESLRSVDMVIPEMNWDQKKDDISKNDIQLLVMGDDWRGAFDDLRAFCEVTYLPRTPLVSSSMIKRRLLEEHAWKQL